MVGIWVVLKLLKVSIAEKKKKRLHLGTDPCEIFHLFPFPFIVQLVEVGVGVHKRAAGEIKLYLAINQLTESSTKLLKQCYVTYSHSAKL